MMDLVPFKDLKKGELFRLKADAFAPAYEVLAPEAVLGNAKVFGSSDPKDVTSIPFTARVWRCQTHNPNEEIAMGKTDGTTAQNDSTLVSVLAGATTTVGIDLLIRMILGKLADIALDNDRADIAEMLCNEDVRSGVKLVAPATALGLVVVLSENDNKTISDWAKSAVEPLKLATASGLASIGSGLIQRFLLDDSADKSRRARIERSKRAQLTETTEETTARQQAKGRKKAKIASVRAL